MKKLFLVSLAVLLTSTISYSQSGWYPQTDSVPGLYMSSIQFTSQNTGYASGSYSYDTMGVFFKTTNGGTNWQRTYFSGMSVDGISFLNDLTGYFIGWGRTQNSNSIGYIYKTTDGAINWVRQDSVLYGNFFQIKFYDVNTGLIAGKYGQAYFTTNGGINWNNISTPRFWEEPQCIWCFDANTWLIGDGGSLIKTTNQGVNWNIDDSSDVTSMCFINNTTGFMTSYWGSVNVYKSTNSGTNWNKIFTGTIPSFYSSSLIFTSANTGYMCGYNSNSVFKTTNGGYNWSEQQINVYATGWHSLSFINDNTGYVVGGKGRIFKTTSGGVGINQISTEIPAKYSLGQNYPNPFNPISNIKYKISKSTDVRITVFDVSGKEVETLVDEKQSPGEYLVTFDARRGGSASLNSGVYFYRMVTDGFTETKKMLLIK